MSFMSVIFRVLNRAGTDFIEPATADRQLPDGHSVSVANQIDQPTRPSDTQPVSGTVSLDAASIAALQHVTAAIEAFPAIYPLPAAQVAALTPQTNGLTDQELRAAAIPVNTGLTQPTTPADIQKVSADALPLPLGAASAAKQLPDNHQVTVSNSSIGLPAAQVTTLTPQKDALTNAQLLAAKLTTLDSTDIEYTSIATTVTAAGDNFVYTPASGKRVRIHWVYAINDPVATSSTRITIKLGAVTFYVAWAISKRQQFTGPVDGAVNINLSSAGSVAVTIFLEEV